MAFRVVPAIPANPAQRPVAYLLTDNWDDWFTFSTMYTLVYVAADGAQTTIGSVKIGQFDMVENQRRADVPQAFDDLDAQFFSVGQDEDYYEKLNGLGPAVREPILRGLRDMAFDLAIFDAAAEETVTSRSLLRYVSETQIRGQFHRMAHGGARLSGYAFTFTPPARADQAPTVFTFEVQPESKPPSNIHVLIGRNGVGKTHLLNTLSKALVEEGADAADVGEVAFQQAPAAGLSAFANLVSVTFSAFDHFEPFPSNAANTSIRYAYIGLRRRTDDADELVAPKPLRVLTREFSDSVKECRVGPRRARWQKALNTLESDPIFREADISALADVGDDEELRAVSSPLFRDLSSGHKIVLLTITRLVEELEERTLVLLDEPEGHLHPPLLSAFIRALSDLLVDRNGVAIIATHSPVVLQEVPRNCVWKVRRVGQLRVAERPEIETFGESVGILTREVFGLEVAESGFHRMLADTVATTQLTFEQTLDFYGGQLGDEARALIRSLIAARNQGGN